MTAQDVKTCAKGHLWMADVPLCPYCHTSPEYRVAAVERQRRPKDSES